MRRKKLPPDQRLDWRDQDMPCLRYGRRNEYEKFHMMVVPPDHIKEYYRRKIYESDGPFGPPDYKSDPSYWWNRKKK